MAYSAASTLTRRFPRIARQLNYQREFLSPTSVRVNIPGGLPYEAFETKGSKVSPWNLLQLFESARVFAFWPLPNAERPKESFADIYKILQDNLLFTATTNLSIKRPLYDDFTPKFPLSVTIKLDYIGRKSILTTSTLAHTHSKPYAVCKLQFILVDPATKKPTAFPDWWRQKHANDSAVHGSALIMKDLPDVDVDQCYRHDVIVNPRDCDAYSHTNWANYVPYCSDACRFGLLKNRFKNITDSLLDSGVKELEMSFRKESSVGDTLKIVSWETGDGLNFRIFKDNDACVQMTMTCFEDKSEDQ